MSLITVQDYVDFARELLQDQKNTPYRFSDDSLIRALTLSLPEAKRLRPDLFLGIPSPLPTYTSADTTPIVPMDEMYRSALAYYMCGIAQLRDDEEVQDQRAAAFLAIFQTKLSAGT